uniref:Uncharacterized protein n=1 Tax=Trichogramma kaykai TaxID=54128 RepID=A0ABD2WBY5_9HYME
MRASETPVARSRRRVRYIPASFIEAVCARDVYNMLRIFASICVLSKDSSANDEGSSRLEGSKCVTVLGDSFPRKSFDDDDDGDEDGQVCTRRCAARKRTCAPPPRMCQFIIQECKSERNREQTRMREGATTIILVDEFCKRLA